MRTRLCLLILRGVQTLNLNMLTRSCLWTSGPDHLIWFIMRVTRITCTETIFSLQATTYFKVTGERVWDAYKFIWHIVYDSKIASTSALRIKLKSVSIFWELWKEPNYHYGVNAMYLSLASSLWKIMGIWRWTRDIFGTEGRIDIHI